MPYLLIYFGPVTCVFCLLDSSKSELKFKSRLSSSQFYGFHCMFLFQCNIAGEVECEFPCYNQLEAEEDTWAPNPVYNGGHFGGVVLQTSLAASHILSVMFPRVQIQLRRNTIRRFDMGSFYTF